MKKINLKNQTENNSKGITLIALVITVIVLLILAGISIVTLSGDDGIIKNAIKTKEQSEIESEKKIIEISVIQAMEKNKHGDLEKSQLEKQMNNNSPNKEIEVMENEKTIIIKFAGSNRCYEINAEGNVSEPIEMPEYKYAGDLSKNGKYDGSEEKPFQIDCIEDIVAFSIMTNGGNEELGITANNFKDKYVVLNKNIDFNSIFSYSDYTTKKYGDLNEDGIVDELKKELTNTGEGAKGFKAITNFWGIFDGKGNMIKNIYQNINESKKETALFVSATNEIKNLSLSGTIINNTWHAGGICSGGKVTISNCKNYADVTGYNMVGGISAWAGGNIYNSINYGSLNITGKSYQYGAAGGITACTGSITIENCINEGNIEGNCSRGGILGCTHGQINITIKNCINKGKAVAGIVDWARDGSISIINCYNLAECDNGIVNGFSGAAWGSILELNIKNSYNIGIVSNCGIIGEQGNTCQEITLNIENCYNAGSSNKAILGKILYNEKTVTKTNILNTYYDTSKSISVGAITDGITGLSEADIKNNTTFIETLNNNIGTNTEWKKWEIGQNGYPTFE